jgi:hypothetical protein
MSQTATKLASNLAEAFKRATNEQGQTHSQTPLQSDLEAVATVVDRTNTAMALYAYAVTEFGYADVRMRQAVHEFIRGNHRMLVDYGAACFEIAGEYESDVKRRAFGSRILDDMRAFLGAFA